MIVHSIVVSKPKVVHLPTASRRWSGKIGTTDHRRFIHQRCLMGNRLQSGDWVRHKEGEGQVIDIFTDFDDALEWDDLRCRFISVYLTHSNTIVMAHHSELKKLK